MRAHRVFRHVRPVLVASIALALACGGGGGGGHGGPVPIAGTIDASGSLGGGRSGWHLEGETPAGTDPLSFHEPGDVFVHGSGDLYVADTGNHRVCRWTADGEFRGWIGGGRVGWQTGEALPESAPRTIRRVYARDVSLDPAGNLIAPSGGCVAKWEPGGRPLGWIGNGRTGWQTDDQPAGSSASYGAFSSAAGAAFAADGTIYVAEGTRISRWTPAGAPDGWIGDGVDGWHEGRSPTWGKQDPRSFYNAQGVSRDGDGNLYVSDWALDRVTKWSADGVFLGWIGQGSDGWRTDDLGTWRDGDDLRSFHFPRSLFVTADGTLYVADTMNDRVVKWDPDGHAVGWIGGGRDGWQTGDAPPPGNDLRSFSGPDDVFVDATGAIYVADAENHRVVRWTAAGVALGWCGGGTDGWRTDPGPDDWGEDLRQFRQPGGICVDADGYLYVSERRRIVKRDADGRAVGWLGSDEEGWVTTGLAPTERRADWLLEPTAVWVDGEENVYVVDSARQRVCRWSADGVAMGWIGSGRDGWETRSAYDYRGSEEGQFDDIQSVCVDREGFLYVSELDNYRVSRFDAEGNARGWIGGGEDGWQAGSGTRERQGIRGFYQATGITVGIDGDLFVADMELARVSRWSKDGVARGWLGGGSDGWKRRPTVYRYVREGECDYRLESESGGDAWSFRNPVGIALDGRGFLYVADAKNQRIGRWSVRNLEGGERKAASGGWIGHARPNWRPTKCSTRSGDGPRQFTRPSGVAVGPDGTVYVADRSNHRIVRWR